MGKLAWAALKIQNITSYALSTNDHTDRNKESPHFWTQKWFHEMATLW